jgi:hypothetical protein|tara:strand:+ start:322 stop:606 length:285 start_codon:yes stop_codon:yes gene_type:complete
MTVKALKKKNNMSGPFKMKGSPMARNFGIGASPARDREDTLQESGGPPKSGDGKPKTGKTYKQAWDQMSLGKQKKHGTFDNFKTAAEKYNKESA